MSRYKFMKQSIIILSILLGIIGFGMEINAYEISFQGNKNEIIIINPEKSTGLENVYVAYNASDLTSMHISGVTPGMAISEYSNLGGGYAQPLTVRYEGDVAVIDKPVGNRGYIIENDGRNYCFWLVDYSSYPLTINNITASPEQDCNSTQLEIAGTGATIQYYTIDGRAVELNREIDIKYYNLDWDEGNEQYIQNEHLKSLSHLTSTVSLIPPLYCNSIFSINGDRFQREWGISHNVESGVIYANGVDVNTSAEQISDSNSPEEEEESVGSNVIKTDVTGLGGSAPAEISFRAWTTDAVIHNEWQFATDPDFEYITHRFNDQNLDYTFNEEGTIYARFVGSNSDGSCEAIGETYTITIGSSELRIPNAFSPNGDGVNDIWKVGYRSLLEFKCTIVDRYGTVMYSFEDPNQGWDGKYKGKLVKPGVYFYSIEAKGADGKKYKKGGDINIIKTKENRNNSIESY